MAKSFSIKTASTELSTILGPDSVVDGNVTVKHSLRIDGQVRGDVTSDESITVGSDGVVEGNLSAADMVMGGKIVGKVTVSGKTVLEASSVLQGDLRTSLLVVEEGAMFRGTSDMGPTKVEHPAHPPRKIKLEDDEGRSGTTESPEKWSPDKPG